MTALQDSIRDIEIILANAKLEAVSLESGRKASSPRLRKLMMDVKNKAHAIRGQVTEFTKSLPTKSRTKKEVVVEPEKKEDM